MSNKVTYIQFVVLWEKFVNEKCTYNIKEKYVAKEIYKHFTQSIDKFPIKIGIKKFYSFCREWCINSKGKVMLEDYKSRTDAVGIRFHGLTLIGIKDTAKEKSDEYIQNWKKEDRLRKGDISFKPRKSSKRSKQEKLERDMWLVDVIKNYIYEHKLPPSVFIESIKSGETKLSDVDKQLILEQYNELLESGKEEKEDTLIKVSSKCPDDSFDWESFIERGNEITLEKIEQWLSNLIAHKQELNPEDISDRLNEAVRITRNYCNKLDHKYQAVYNSLLERSKKAQFELECNDTNQRPKSSGRSDNLEEITSKLSQDPSEWTNDKNKIQLVKEIEKWIKDFKNIYSKNMDSDEIFELLNSARNFVRNCSYIDYKDKTRINEILLKLVNSVELLDDNVDTVNIKNNVDSIELDKGTGEININLKKNSPKREIGKIKTNAIYKFKEDFLGYGGNKFRNILNLTEQTFNQYIDENYHQNINKDIIKETLKKKTKVIFIQNSKTFWD